MEMTLTDLSILIELTERELNTLHKIIDDPNSDDDAADDAAEIAVQIANVAGKLKLSYESQWTSDCNYESYDSLIKRHQDAT